MKPFKAWLLLDSQGTYFPSVHKTRRDAEEEAGRWSYLRDAKWRVVRVDIRATSTSVRERK